MNSYVIVTGSDKFVGRNLVNALKRRDTDVVEYGGVCEDEELVRNADAVFHMASCQYIDDKIGIHEMMKLSFTQSKDLFDLCQKVSTSFIYMSSASVYGDKKNNIEKPTYEVPLTELAKSKLLFDNYVRCFLTSTKSQIIGIRNFNVYGPGEEVEELGASVIYKFYKQAETTGVIKPFSGSQTIFRDYVYIDDVVEVLLYLQKKEVSGIFNCGTGICAPVSEVIRDLKRHILFREEGITFPEALRGKYQTYTRSVNDVLLETGYSREFVKLFDGIERYASYLKKLKK